MEYSRELYWNIGHGAKVLLPMYLFTFAALGFLVISGLRRLRIYRQGKPLNRTDKCAVRIGELVKNVLFQSRVLLVKGPGYAHGLFFWGFFLLFIGTCFVAFQADFTDPLFGYRFLNGNFYKFFSLVLDLAGLAAFAMLLGLLVRRYLVRPEGLESTRDDAIMHWLLFAILITGFVIEGARMAVTELPDRPDLTIWSPVGLLFAKALIGLSDESLRILHQALWWLHFLLVIGFICAIPYTKFRHILTTSANYFFTDLGPKGALATINLEDESLVQFGAAKIADLTWKDIFDTDACTKCKRCQDRCPAHNTDKPLSPMKVINQLGELACTNPEANLIETISQDALWACTTCRACQEICPASIEHVNKIIEMRRNLTLMEGAFPGDEVRTAVSNIEVNGNPFGLAYAARGDWAEGLQLSLMEQDADVEILYFVGCYASFDKRNQAIARNFITICNAAGVKVGILGKEEKCCGEPVKKLGNEYLYQMTATENIELIKAYNVKKIVTTCPHCFNTLARDYKDLGLDIPVEHYSTYINTLLNSDRLKLTPEPFECTYHDSCYVGRYMDIIDQPRAILKAAGGSISEMGKNGYDSFCCSAGGGRIIAEEKLGSKISEARIKMATDTGAPLLISNCPFCLTMFEDGIKTGGAEEQLLVRDLAEIVVERLAS